jgi:HTH-type transcriptional regulator/antitoxin HigA
MIINFAEYKTPGQLIDDLLTDRGWTKRVLAIVLGVEETGISRLTSDKRPVDAKTALVLQEVFGVPAEVFLELQKIFDLAQARIVAKPDPTRATRAQLFGDLPITEMVKRGWLDAPSIRDVAEIEKALIAFFGVKTAEEIQNLPHAAKKTDAETPLTLVQLAWLYRVKQIAKDMLVGRYSPQAVASAVENLKNLLGSVEEARKVPRILSECGIRFVIVECLSSTKIDGVCFWLNDFSPVIGMSLRHDRIDNFWFVLRHEIEHILKGHGREVAILDADLDGEKAGLGPNVTAEEKIANEAAANFCVPAKMLSDFIIRKAPFFAKEDIIGFSKVLKVHPGLVAGQIQHKTGRYDRFRDHLEKIRAIVAPGAIVDGWGDVAPVEP